MSVLFRLVAGGECNWCATPRWKRREGGKPADSRTPPLRSPGKECRIRILASGKPRCPVTPNARIGWILGGGEQICHSGKPKGNDCRPFTLGWPCSLGLVECREPLLDEGGPKCRPAPGPSPAKPEKDRGTIAAHRLDSVVGFGRSPANPHPVAWVQSVGEIE